MAMKELTVGTVVLGSNPTPRERIFGPKLVFGVPVIIKPIVGLPPGKVKVRFRNTSVACVFIRGDYGIRQFYLEDKGDHWYPCFEVARNYRLP
jgi:hypothetical protein